MTKQELWELAIGKGYKPSNGEIIFNKPITIKGKSGDYKIRSIKNKDGTFILYTDKPKPKPKYSGRLAN